MSLKNLNRQIDQHMMSNPRKPKEIGYYERVAKMFDVNPEKVRKRWRVLVAKASNSSLNTTDFVQAEHTPISNGHSITVSANGNTDISTVVDEEIKNEKDLIRVCSIDTNIYTVSSFRVAKNFTGKYSVQVSLKPKKVDENLTEQGSLILQEIRRQSLPFKRKFGQVYVKPYVSIDHEKAITRDCALEINVPDLHLGKLAWGKENGGDDYDIKIAVAEYKKAVKELLSRVNPLTLEKFILPVGNDMINIDNKANTTTGGTPQSCDSRFGKIFQTAKELLIETIDELSQIAPVEVIVIPGNHDTVAMFTLGEVLDAWYHNNDQVNVSNTHTPRKYHQYGNNLLMYVHGHNEKLSELGIICATEQPHLWAATKFRRVHVGHFHHSKQVKYLDVQEYQGFTVKILNSLSANDAWHEEKGYKSLKGAEAFLYHRDKGLLANYYYYKQ
jgi:hypothetical protein